MAEIFHFTGVVLLLFSLFFYIGNYQEINKEYGKFIKQGIKDAREMYIEVYGPTYSQIKKAFPLKKKIDEYKSHFHPNIKYHRRMMKPNKE